MDNLSKSISASCLHLHFLVSPHSEVTDVFYLVCTTYPEYIQTLNDLSCNVDDADTMPYSTETYFSVQREKLLLQWLVSKWVSFWQLFRLFQLSLSSPQRMTLHHYYLKSTAILRPFLITDKSNVFWSLVSNLEQLLKISLLWINQ